MHADDQRPEGATQTDARDEPSTGQSADDEPAHLCDQLDSAEFFESDSHAAFAWRAEKEKLRHCEDHRLAEAIKDDETENGAEAGLAEISDERFAHGRAAHLRANQQPQKRRG